MTSSRPFNSSNLLQPLAAPCSSIFSPPSIRQINPPPAQSLKPRWAGLPRSLTFEHSSCPPAVARWAKTLPVHAGFPASGPGGLRNPRLSAPLRKPITGLGPDLFLGSASDSQADRAEERRVGKEWRSRWAPD